MSNDIFMIIQLFIFLFYFLGDREKFSLPEDMPVMHFEYTQFYYPGNTEFPCKFEKRKPYSHHPFPEKKICESSLKKYCNYCSEKL